MYFLYLICVPITLVANGKMKVQFDFIGAACGLGSVFSKSSKVSNMKNPMGLLQSIIVFL